MELQTIVVGVLAALAAVALAIYVGKRGILDTSEEDQSRDEIRERQERDDWSIPARKRYKALPGPLRALAVATVLVGVAAAYGLTIYLRTGAPAGSFLTSEVQYAIVGVAGVFGGVYLTRKMDSRRARMWVAHEREGEEPAIDEIPFNTASRTIRNGATIVTELARHRIFGLFNRYRQVGERRELRSNNSLPSDRVEHNIPPHAVELPSGDVYIPTQEDGDRVLAGGSQADKTYRSKNQMSYEESVTLREKMSRMRSRMQAVKATNAQLMDDIKSMKKEIENREYQEREDLVDELGEMLEALAPALQMQSGGFSTIDSRERAVSRAENGEGEA